MPAQSVTALSQALHERKISAVELTTDAIKRIHSEHALNAFISVNDDQALIEAQHADRQLQKGLGTRLTGIPMAHKDIFCTKTLPTTCGSKMLANFTAPYQATLVEKLASNGVVMMGKTNMDEFAMGSTNESSYFGAVKNPWDKTRVPGGSSGGSAAAVAASLCAFSTGSDTGGSVRQPAALCGISGLKPTYGLISRYGMVAYASSLDTAGILARSAEDIALILEASVGFDELDSTSLNQPAVNYLSETKKPIEAFRVGLPRCFLSDKIEPDIQTAVLNTVRLLEQLGAQIVEMDLPLQPYWIPCYYVLACAEASSNLSRYDGIRYGHRSSIDTSIEALVTHSREEGFGAEVKRRILTGIHVLSAGYYEDYYVRAQKVRRLIRNELCSALSSVDFILGPTTPTCAFKLNTPITDPTEAYLADVFTVGANLAGVPALSIPGGFNHAGLPIGIQFIGAHFSEARLLQVAHAIQQHTLWHQMTPTAQGVKS